jgi:hypothetical protein
MDLVTSGSIFGSGTMLQEERSPVRFTMSLDFSIKCLEILRVATLLAASPGGLSSIELFRFLRSRKCIFVTFRIHFVTMVTVKIY